VVSGHIGSAGRAGFFLLVAILMFRSVVRDQDLRTNNTTTFGNALQSLRVSEPRAVAVPLLGWRVASAFCPKQN